VAGHGFFACVDDLEDELIRALGTEAVERVLDVHGELASFRRMEAMPQHRGSPVERSSTPSTSPGFPDRSPHSLPAWWTPPIFDTPVCLDVLRKSSRISSVKRTYVRLNGTLVDVVSGSQLLGSVETLDIAGLDAAGVEIALRVVARVRGHLDLLTSALVARADALASTGQSADGDSVLRTSGRLSGREARAVGSRSRTLAAQPALAAALTAGDVSAGHVDAIAAAASKLSAEQQTELTDQSETLTEVASMMPVDLFERYMRNIADELRADDGLSERERQRRATRLRRWRNKATGMCHLSGQFDPETGARLFSAIEAEANALRKQADAGPVGSPDTEPLDDEQIEAQALANLLLETSRSKRPGHTEVVVLVDLDTLLHGVHAHTVCETSDGAGLAVASMRRLLCDAAILPAVLGGDGQVLDLGREERHANRAQRRALRAQYRTCGFPDCDVSFDWCEIHHVLAFERGGPTDWANLIPLCSRHHHLVHEGRWRLTLSPSRTVSVWRPDGELYTRRPFTAAYARPAGRAGRPRAGAPPGDQTPHQRGAPPTNHEQLAS
jgi:hypothetical protein